MQKHCQAQRTPYMTPQQGKGVAEWDTYVQRSIKPESLLTLQLL